MLPSSTSVILDIETLSTRHDSVITEIAILAFDASSFAVIHEREIMPDLYSQLALGRHVCPDTIDFHRRNASLHINLHGQDSLKDVAFLMEDFFYQFPPHEVWIQGPDFDSPILEHFLAQLGRKLPWDFWRTRCSRTAWNLAFPGVKHSQRPHSALGDCKATLADLQASILRLKGSPPTQPTNE